MPSPLTELIDPAVHPDQFFEVIRTPPHRFGRSQFGQITNMCVVEFFKESQVTSDDTAVWRLRPEPTFLSCLDECILANF